MPLLPLTLRFIMCKPLKIPAVLYKVQTFLFEQEVLKPFIQIYTHNVLKFYFTFFEKILSYETKSELSKNVAIN